MASSYSNTNYDYWGGDEIDVAITYIRDDLS